MATAAAAAATAAAAAPNKSLALEARLVCIMLPKYDELIVVLLLLLLLLMVCLLLLDGLELGSLAVICLNRVVFVLLCLTLLLI